MNQKEIGLAPDLSNTTVSKTDTKSIINQNQNDTSLFYDDASISYSLSTKSHTSHLQNLHVFEHLILLLFDHAGI